MYSVTILLLLVTPATIQKLYRGDIYIYIGYTCLCAEIELLLAELFTSRIFQIQTAYKQDQKGVTHLLHQLRRIYSDTITIYTMGLIRSILLL